MSDTLDLEKQEQWWARAKSLLEQALAEWDEVEQFGAVEAAFVAMRIADGQVPADELDGYPFPGEEPDMSACICPPDLLARGGFKGGCVVHGGV